MARTIADRLSEAAERSFVGRDAELGVLRQAIEADELPFLVAFVHGPGGIGKSRLMRAAIDQSTPAARGVCLDCATIEPTPRGFLAAFGDSIGASTTDVEDAAERLGEGGRRSVVALDTYEAFGLLDTWLRQTFLPQMPDTVLTVMAGREPPSPAWSTSPGWQGLVNVIELRGLGESDARAMLTARGLSEEQAARANRFTRGHPLALELAAAALRGQPDLEIASGPPARVLQELTRAFLAELSRDLAEAVRAASTLRRVTEPGLDALLGPRAGGPAFEQLRALPFVDSTAHGLALHDVVRDTVARDLAARDPVLHRRYRRCAWRFLTAESSTTAGLNFWQQTADLLFLIQNPGVRQGFFPAGASEITLAPAVAADGAAIAEIGSRTEPADAARLLERWWEARPDGFHVARDAAGDAVAFYVLFEPGDGDAALREDDPLTAAWMEHLRQNPVAEGERVLFLRRWLDRMTGDMPSAAQGACWLDVKRTYMELRPDLRRLYTTAREPGAYAIGALGFVPLPAATVEIGGAPYHTAMLDFGEGSVDGWLARLIGEELGACDDDEPGGLPEGTVTIMFTDIADSTGLTERLGDGAFRDLARGLEGSLRAIIGEAGGVVVEGKLLGDGVMAVFTSARQAIEAAIRSAAAATEEGIGLHVGLHAGDVIRDGGNVFGGAVNIAARVAGLAPAGEVMVSETVRALARTSAGVRFDDRGLHRLKGVEDSHRLHAVVAEAVASAPAGS